MKNFCLEKNKNFRKIGEILIKNMKKIITGVKPTGSSMHLGNLLGAILPLKNTLD